MLPLINIESTAACIAVDLQICLLGSPTVERDQLPVVIPRRRVRTLLYYLVTAGQPVSRAQLCQLFWSDSPDTLAHRNLTHLLTHLRRALPDPNILVTRSNCISLDPLRIWSDLQTFTRLRMVSGDADRTHALQQAADLYRGPFLAGFSLAANPDFEAWMTLEQRIWEQHYLDTLAELIERQATQGAYAAAIDNARRYLLTDNFNEDMHRRLMELYAASNDHHAALRQFDECTTLLERELGAPPLPETQTAYQVVCQRATAPRTERVTRPAWTILPSLLTPIAGRDRELGQLHQAFTDAQAGHGRCLLITGEQGMGKSRLLQAFAAQHQQQALILAGAGHPAEQHLLYQPVIEALRLALNNHGTMAYIPSVWLAAVSRLLPELHTLHPGLPTPLPLEPAQERAQVFEGLYQFMLGLSQHTGPVVLCIDDLDWADAETRAWLAYLGRRLRGTRILLIAACRDAASDSLAQFRYELVRAGVVEDLDLDGLDAVALRHLLSQIGGPLPNLDGLARQLQTLTGGNPFFLLELCHALDAAGYALEQVADLDQLPVTPLLREMVRTRCRQLSPLARRLLEAAAIIKAQFTFQAIHLTARYSDLETIDGLDELAASRLLVAQPDGYRFTQDITRQIILAELSPLRHEVLCQCARRAQTQLAADAVARTSTD